MLGNIFGFIGGLDLDFMIKLCIAIFVIILGFKVVNKILKLVLKVVGIALIITLIFKALGLV